METINSYFLLLFFFISCAKGTTDKEKKSIGTFSNEGKRIGEWKYLDEKGKLMALGKYNNGLKEGVWNYGKKTYNNSYNVDWRIIVDNSFKFNIPSDWKIKDENNFPIKYFFFYNELGSPNGNITLIEKEKNKSLNEVFKSVLDQDISKNGELLEIKDTEINGLKSIYSQQVLIFKGEKIFIEIFLIEGKKWNYLLSFFVKDSYISKYHRVFSEISYSFSLQ